MCEEINITSRLLDITKTLAEKNVNFSISLKFTMKEKEFKFDASSSQKDQDHPVLLKKRKKKSPSQKARSLKRLLEYKEKNRKKSELTTSPVSSTESSDVTLSSKDDSVKTAFSCDQCKHTTKTENGMKRHMKNKHDLEQLDGNSSICEEEIETPSFECTFCGDNFESEIKQHWQTFCCPKNSRAQELRQQGEQMHQRSLQGGFPPGMF